MFILVGFLLGILCFTIWRKKLGRVSRIHAGVGLAVVAAIGILFALLYLFGTPGHGDIFDYY